MKRRRGFTLLEMMVASTIMAIAIVGLLACISGATRNASRLRDYDRAVQLARWRMSELMADESLQQGSVLSGGFDRNLSGGLEAGWQARVSTIETPPVMASGQPVLQRIELQVWWMSGEQRRSFTLDAHRSHILLPGEL